MVRRVITHVPNPYEFETVPIRLEDVIAPRAEDGAQSHLCPTEELSEVPYQVNETVLRKEVRHALAS